MSQSFPRIKSVVHSSEGRESLSRLGLETKGTETLGLISVSYKVSELVSSRMKHFGTVSSRSCPGLVPVSSRSRPSFVPVSSRLPQLYSVSS